MRNMIMALVALAMLALAGNVMAVEFGPDASSILVSSASDLPVDSSPHKAFSSHTMVGTAADAPETDEATIVESPAEVVHYHQGYYAPNCCCAPVCREPSLFDKLMDLERKKNAWLMRTFLGR